MGNKSFSNAFLKKLIQLFGRWVSVILCAVAFGRISVVQGMEAEDLQLKAPQLVLLLTVDPALRQTRLSLSWLNSAVGQMRTQMGLLDSTEDNGSLVLLSSELSALMEEMDGAQAAGRSGTLAVASWQAFEREGLSLPDALKEQSSFALDGLEAAVHLQRLGIGPEVPVFHLHLSQSLENGADYPFEFWSFFQQQYFIWHHHIELRSQDATSLAKRWTITRNLEFTPLPTYASGSLPQTHAAEVLRQAGPAAFLRRLQSEMDAARSVFSRCSEMVSARAGPAK